MKVVPDAQSSAPKRRHPAANVLGDAPPSLLVGAEQGIRPNAALGGHEPRLTTVQQHIELVRAGSGETDPCAAATLNM